jgi:YD repeat-containing protein
VHEYDAVGNLSRSVTSDGAVTAYDVDLGGRLVGVVTPGVALAREYDLWGRVLSEWVNGQRTEVGHAALILHDVLDISVSGTKL